MSRKISVNPSCVETLLGMLGMTCTEILFAWVSWISLNVQKLQALEQILQEVNMRCASAKRVQRSSKLNFLCLRGHNLPREKEHYGTTMTRVTRINSGYISARGMNMVFASYSFFWLPSAMVKWFCSSSLSVSDVEGHSQKLVNVFYILLFTNTLP